MWKGLFLEIIAFWEENNAVGNIQGENAHN